MHNEAIMVDAQEREPIRVEEMEDAIPAWTEVEAGRFMPRRIRGSFRGNKLG
ncbi:MAG TPA: hypothetical protein VHR66_20870 [Gemmataceae bacterium]|jgi:hypothetical protein|nr:hypothetical protein [Gemmataceae bacterium]